MATMFEKKRKRKKSLPKYLDAPCTSAEYDKKWQVERDLESLCRAEAVKKDPERMKLCKQLAAEKLEENKRKKDEAQALIDMGIEGESL